jgi:sugar lactone lactonase YvrE
MRNYILIQYFLFLTYLGSYGQSIEFIKEISSFSNGGYQINNGVATCSSGDTIFVADKYSRILAFTNEGRFLFKFGSSTLFKEIVAICENGSGVLYVLDFSKSTVFKFTKKGKLLISWRIPFSFPQGIACDSKGNVYVSVENKILKYDSNGKLVFKSGKYGDLSGQFNEAIGLAFDSRDILYVADQYNHRIQKIDTNGQFFASFETRNEVYFPSQIAVKDSCIYITEDRQFIAKYSLNGLLTEKIRLPFYTSKMHLFCIDKNNHFFIINNSGELNSMVVKLDIHGNKLLTWGNQPIDTIGFNQPLVLADYNKNELLIVEKSGVIKTLNPSSGKIKVIGLKEFDPFEELLFNRNEKSIGYEKQQISNPNDMVYDKIQNNIYFSSESSSLSSIKLEKSEKGKKIKEYQSLFKTKYVPYGISNGEKNKIYFTIPEENKVLCFDIVTKEIFEWGQSRDSVMNLIHPIAITYHKNKVYVVDKQGIKIFDKEGGFISKWTSLDINVLDFVSDLASDKKGNIYALLGNSSEVQVFSKDGKFLSRFGKKNEEYDLSKPNSIIIKKDRIYITNTNEDKINIYKIKY